MFLDSCSLDLSKYKPRFQIAVGNLNVALNNCMTVELELMVYTGFRLSSSVISDSTLISSFRKH